MRKIQFVCACSKAGEFDICFNLKRMVEEIVELIKHPSMEELSDVLMCCSCLLHSLNHKWVWLVPGSEIAQDKGLMRYREHGCCRSLKHSCNK